MKILFNITFHWQIEQLKFHLDNLFTWKISDDSQYLITSAHKENILSIQKYCETNYPTKNVRYIFIEEDKGYHIGTIVNVVESIKFASSNLHFDYLVNVEADNMFYDESKLLKIVNTMKEKDKHCILIEEGYGKTPQNVNWNKHASFNHLHITTLNIFSKNFILNYYPLDYIEDIMNWGWLLHGGTPFEAYISYAFLIKNGLYEDEKIMDFWNGYGLRLEFDRNKIVIPGWHDPDHFVPDKFMRWGLVAAPATNGDPKMRDWNIMKKFIELHKPLMYDTE